MRTTGLLLLVFLLVAVPVPSLSQITLEPYPMFGSPVIIPSHELALTANTHIACVITEPSDPPTLETRWIHPNGMIITQGHHRRFTTSLGNIALPSGEVPATTLLILMLSYEDAGTYSCEVRNESDPDGPWSAGELEFQLDVNLQVNNDSITVNTSAETVELHCEMFDYIRPDSDLQWFSGGNVITNGTNRRTITYIDGTPDTAQNGGSRLVPGRVAVLAITNPQVSDSGTNTCRLSGAGVSTDVQLTVTGGPSLSTTGPSTSTTPGPGGTDSEFPLPAVIGGIATLLGIIVLLVLSVTVGFMLMRKINQRELPAIAMKSNDSYGPVFPELMNTAAISSHESAVDTTMNSNPSYTSRDEVEIKNNPSYILSAPGREYEEIDDEYEEVDGGREYEEVDDSGDTAHGTVY